MNTTKQYRLGKKNKLKSRKQINALFASGKKINHFPVRAIWMPSSSNHSLQVGFSVSSRHFKRAVDRNRIKRLMRESYRLQKNELEILLTNTNRKIVLFLNYTGKDLPLFSDLYNTCGLVLQSLINNLHKIPASNIE